MSAPTAPPQELFPGYAVPAGSYSAPPLQKTSHLRLAAAWGIAIAVVAAALVGLSAVVTKPSARFMCPPECGSPPTGTPLATNPRFTATDGAFSVSYPAAGTAYNVTQKPNGVTAEFTAGDGGMLQLFSMPAAGLTPKAIADKLVKKTFPAT